MPSSGREATIFSFVLADRRVIAALTLGYIALGVAFVRTDYTLHD
jgi:hypothetical protein